jgi:hypothetical protein
MVKQAMQRPDDFGSGLQIYRRRLSHEALSFDQGIEFTLQDLGRNKPGIAELNPLRFADMDLVRSLKPADSSNAYLTRKSI